VLTVSNFQSEAVACTIGSTFKTVSGAAAHALNQKSGGKLQLALDKITCSRTPQLGEIVVILSRDFLPFKYVMFGALSSKSHGTDEQFYRAVCLLYIGSIFSSPEHEVLMVSYCGQWVVRRRPSSVVSHPSSVNF